MGDVASNEEPLDALRAMARGVADGSLPAYDTGSEMWGLAMANAERSDTYLCLYLLWASLTDWIETRPEVEHRAAEASMREAARQWLEVENDPEQRQRYFDYWLYEVIGYEPLGADEQAPVGD